MDKNLSTIGPVFLLADMEREDNDGFAFSVTATIIRQIPPALCPPVAKQDGRPESRPFVWF
ncbi:hypothetical protein TALK_12120 [Thalassospira alkalitolerans]|uniref:Uncharacterized protein n=1 Tax=Thalassospira alkalitolerans TaxID=1293890 RepID=A0A1Y2LB11_9PROT|nr:hypothetical protein TALK_12120 [Thalassospira alkalitolerans]